MFRFSYTLCSWLAGFFAVLSPVAILHWLMKTMQIPGTASFVFALDPAFAPLNAIVELFWKAPPLTFMEQPVSTTQGVLAIVFTLGFFALNAVSEALKSLEQKVNVGREALVQKQRMLKLNLETKKQKKQVITAGWRIYTHVQYDFIACAQGASLIQDAATRYGGEVKTQMPDFVTLEFKALERALQYCLETSKALQAHYATLRPMDAKPPFRMGAHAVDTSLSASASLSETQRIASFAGANQVVVSQSVQLIMDAQGLSRAYQCSSMGIYALEDGRQEEIFGLLEKKRDTF